MPHLLTSNRSRSKVCGRGRAQCIFDQRLGVAVGLVGLAAGCLGLGLNSDLSSNKGSLVRQVVKSTVVTH